MSDFMWQNYEPNVAPDFDFWNDQILDNVGQPTVRMDNQSQIEELADLIYATLKGDEVTANIGERAYITDILSEAIFEAGFRKEVTDG